MEQRTSLSASLLSAYSFYHRPTNVIVLCIKKVQFGVIKILIFLMGTLQQSSDWYKLVPCLVPKSLGTSADISSVTANIQRHRHYSQCVF